MYVLYYIYLILPFWPGLFGNPWVTSTTRPNIPSVITSSATEQCTLTKVPLPGSTTHDVSGYKGPYKGVDLVKFTAINWVFKLMNTKTPHFL